MIMSWFSRKGAGIVSKYLKILSVTIYVLSEEYRREKSYMILIFFKNCCKTYLTLLKRT